MVKKKKNLNNIDKQQKSSIFMLKYTQVHFELNVGHGYEYFILCFWQSGQFFLKEFNEIYRISDKNVYLRDRIF